MKTSPVIELCFISVCMVSCCIKQRNFCPHREEPKGTLHSLWIRTPFTSMNSKPGSGATDEYKEMHLANILKMKKHQV